MTMKIYRLIHRRTHIYAHGIVFGIVTALFGVGMMVQAYAATPYTADQYASSLDSTIHADDTQSVTLPNGNMLWVFGDTIQVNGASTVSGYGYPHDEFVVQAPGTLTFTPVAGQYGYGWQQVPNWSDGSYFWMSTPVVDGNNLYVFGQRIQGVSPFTVVGSYVAIFDANTLAYQKIVPIPSGATGQTGWGGAVKTATGWWITGTHPVSCSYVTDCKMGDVAHVPLGKLAIPSGWSVYNNVIPSTTNVGTTLALIRISRGWDIFTKTGDAYGGTTIERLSTSAFSPTSGWKVNASWAAPAPSGAVSYGVAVHPEQAAPAGQVLVSYNVNDFQSTCWPLFSYLPE